VTTDAFLDAARKVETLLDAPELAYRWDTPSVLRDFSTSALAGHLARAVFTVAGYLEADLPPGTAQLTVVDYIRQVGDDSDPASERNTAIRDRGRDDSRGGIDDLRDRYRAAVADLATRLAHLPAEHPVRMLGPSRLTLADCLTTRLIELVVHADDLATSIGAPAPDFDDETMDLVITTLARVSSRKHGAWALIRTLSRSERAPASVSAF
jgi:uncharacterized protein (TIGR03083 family)